MLISEDNDYHFEKLPLAPGETEYLAMDYLISMRPKMPIIKCVFPIIPCINLDIHGSIL